MLFLTFLVLAFARPFIPATDESLAPNAVIYFDNSYSMSNESDIEVSAFEEGIQIMEELVNAYPRDTRFKLITNDFQPFSNIFRTKNEIFERITELSYSHITRTGGEIISRLNSEVVENSDVYWIGDFQKSLTGSNIAPDPGYQLRIFPLEYTSFKNIYIDTVFVVNPFSNSPEFKIRLSNTGNQEQNNVAVKLFINDLQVSTQSVDIPGMGREDIIFEYNKRVQENLYGKIEVEDFPVTFDNELYFYMKKPARVNILEISDNPQNETIKNVYANKEIFNISSTRPYNIDYNTISDWDVIILNEMNSLPTALSLSLNNFHQNGGTLIIIPSDLADDKFYNRIPRGNLISKNLEENRIEFASPDYNNPFFNNVFEDKTESIDMPEGQRVIGWGSDRDAILKLKNGLPFLSKFPDTGDVYCFAAPFKRKYTDFHYHAIFVPVMYKIAILNKSLQAGLYQNMNNPVFEVRVKALRQGRILKLQRNSSELVPEQKFFGKKMVFELPLSESKTGFYDLLYGNDSVGAIALNNDKRESLMEQYLSEDIDEAIMGNNFEVLSNVKSDELQAYFGERFEGISLWKYAVILALIFLLTEILLLRFMK